MIYNKKSLIYQLGKILGFDDYYLQDLEEQYQKANERGKYEIMDVLWKNFFDLYERLTASKYGQFLKEVALGRRKLTSNMYQQAQEEVKTYFQKILTGELEDEEKLNQIREKISQLIRLTNN